MILICVSIYVLTCIPVYILTWNFDHLMMAWNVFLALLPLVFALLLQNSRGEKSRAKTVLLSILWVVTFPNAPYVVTDFIHINVLETRYIDGGYVKAVYSENIIQWLRFVHIGIGVMLGTAIGLYSLYIIHNILLKKIKKPAANAAVCVVCLLGGYAVYIGRFLRFNSWDILRPVSLVSELAGNINWFSFGFSLMFSAYILFTYCIFYAFCRMRVVQTEEKGMQ